ncbi:MAG: MFS transporter [Bacteroidales bacterium]|jgi:Na+/melibiose symporter-like transporter|nr:MFS transporter [Bacteroidales bacterium]MEE3463627.1 MFS transporter [Candidatus Cryptobacteroides sp.]SKC55011.1 MFS/sugar transport protein [Bacteroidales bacterium WCE2008]MBQ2109008.1 MFS transporter [Bacteroidales bacterium]MBQ3917463.1 MFS transporter [Bacteroidales bacterium]
MANNESKGFYKLNWAQRIGFGSGDLAQNLIFQTVACYLMLYLTTVLKINPAFVSGLILSVRLIDCFWSPIVGRYIDNRNPKLGKYRSYLLYGGIPLTIAACLLMLPQAAAWSMTMKIIYATVSYTLLSMIYSVVNIPYGSIMASMTRDNDEVLILTSTRMVCANIGQIVVQAGFPIGLAMVAHTAIDWNQAIFMAIGTIPAFVILPSLPVLKRWLGKKGLYYMLLSIGFVGFAALYVIGKFFDVESNNTLVQTAKVMTGVGLLVGSLMWALVPEVITEAEFRTGNRPAATVNALAGVAFKAGFSIAGWITPLVMGMIGFNLASEQSALPTAPKAWFTVTCIFAIVGFVLLTLCFLGSKENITTTPEKPVSFGEMWKEFKANKCLQLVLGIFVVVFLASFISAPVNAYYVKLNEYSTTAQNAILWFTCIIPAILLIIVGYLIYKYPLTDEKLDEMSRKIEEKN